VARIIVVVALTLLAICSWVAVVFAMPSSERTFVKDQPPTANLEAVRAESFAATKPAVIGRRCSRQAESSCSF
jgi:hypothetical protein